MAQQNQAQRPKQASYSLPTYIVKAQTPEQIPIGREADDALTTIIYTDIITDRDGKYWDGLKDPSLLQRVADLFSFIPGIDGIPKQPTSPRRYLSSILAQENSNGYGNIESYLTDHDKQIAIGAIREAKNTLRQLIEETEKPQRYNTLLTIVAEYQTETKKVAKRGLLAALSYLTGLTMNDTRELLKNWNKKENSWGRNKTVRQYLQRLNKTGLFVIPNEHMHPDKNEQYLQMESAIAAGTTQLSDSYRLDDLLRIHFTETISIQKQIYKKKRKDIEGGIALFISKGNNANAATLEADLAKIPPTENLTLDEVTQEAISHYLREKHITAIRNKEERAFLLYMRDYLERLIQFEKKQDGLPEKALNFEKALKATITNFFYHEVNGVSSQNWQQTMRTVTDVMNTIEAHLRSFRFYGERTAELNISRYKSLSKQQEQEGIVQRKYDFLKSAYTTWVNEKDANRKNQMMSFLQSIDPNFDEGVPNIMTTEQIKEYLMAIAKKGVESDKKPIPKVAIPQ